MVYHFTLFIFILLVPSYLKWVYCRHQIIGLCFFIQYENLYPFQGEFGSCISSVQSLSHVRVCNPMDWARQASLSITNSRSLLKLMSIESVMPSNHLILYHPLLLLPAVFPNIRTFPNELVLRIRWPKYWSFSFSIMYT